MIENFTPADTTLSVKADVDGPWLTVVGWSNTTEGLRPVVVAQRTPCYPQVLADPVRYGDPSLAIALDSGAEIYIAGEVDASVHSAGSTNTVYVSNAD